MGINGAELIRGPVARGVMRLTALTTYLALLLLPAIQLPVRELASIWMGGEDQDRKCRYLAVLSSLLICAPLYYWVRKYSLPLASLGLQFERLPSALWIGLVAGLPAVPIILLPLALAVAMAYRIAKRLGYKVPSGSSSTGGAETSNRHLTRGSVWMSVLLLAVAAFAEEFWRAFCLVGLNRTGHTLTFAVAVSSAVFGVAHLRRRAPALAVVAVLYCYTALAGVFAILFLWSNSLVTAWVAHFASNGFTLYLDRNVTSRRAGSEGVAKPSGAPGVRGGLNPS